MRGARHLLGPPRHGPDHTWQVMPMAEQDATMSIRGDRVRRRYEHGYAQVPRLLLLSEPPPSAYAVHCFALLDMHANYHTGDCYPAQSTLMREMGVSHSTVRRALDELESLGFIERFPRLDPRYGRVGTDYDLLDTPLASVDPPPCSPENRGGAATEHGGCSVENTKQATEGNELQSTAANARARARDATAAASPSALSEPGADAAEVAEVLNALLAMAPGADVRAVPGWIRDRGLAHVKLRIEWIAAILGDPKHPPIESPVAYLYSYLDVPDSQPPAAYRRLASRRERADRLQTRREADAAKAEQAAAADEENRQRLRAVRATYAALPSDRQVEIDAAARAAVVTGPVGRIVEMPPASDAWEARTVGASLWRQAIGELLQNGEEVTP